MSHLDELEKELYKSYKILKQMEASLCDTQCEFNGKNIIGVGMNDYFCQMNSMNDASVNSILGEMYEKNEPNPLTGDQIKKYRGDYFTGTPRYYRKCTEEDKQFVNQEGITKFPSNKWGSDYKLGAGLGMATAGAIAMYNNPLDWSTHVSNVLPSFMSNVLNSDTGAGTEKNKQSDAGNDVPLTKTNTEEKGSTTETDAKTKVVNELIQQYLEDKSVPDDTKAQLLPINDTFKSIGVAFDDLNKKIKTSAYADEKEKQADELNMKNLQTQMYRIKNDDKLFAKFINGQTDVKSLVDELHKNINGTWSDDFKKFYPNPQ
jgi:hypothetical protein